MIRRRPLTIAVLAFATTFAGAQDARQQRQARIPDYAGVRTEVPGIWLTPVANSPFTANVDILTHEPQPDGTERIRTSTNHIARSASGRIYNERRVLVPSTFKGLPPLLSAHTYDPNTHRSVVLNPREHLARQVILAHPAPVIAGFAPLKINPNPGPGRTEEEIGSQVFQGYTLQGIRKTLTVAATASGTGKPITVVDEYWFSPELSVYMLIRHNDPRSGEQLVTVTNVERTEPDPAVFAVPADFKLVDETPPEQPTVNRGTAQ